MRVKFHFDAGYVGTETTETVELPDDYTNEDINDEFDAWCSELYSAYWERVD